MHFPESAIQEVLGVLRKHTGLSNSRNLATSCSNNASELPTVESIETDAYLIETLLANIRHGRNFLVPIHLLPQEILVIILREVLELEGIGEERYHASKRLAAVSSHWLSTILSTPQLWTVINSRLPFPLIESVIRRSKAAPLDIYLYEAEYSVLENIFDLVIPHIGRWRTLQISSCKFPDLLRRIGDLASIPRLEYFKVTASYKAEEVPNFIRCGAPRLHTLSVVPFSLPLEAPVLTSVRRLEFTPVVEGFELSPSQWQAILCSFPQLEFIHVDGVPDMKPKHVPFPPFHASIPNLQKISLVMLPASTIGALLSSICVDDNVFPHIEIRGVRAAGGNGGMRELFPASSEARSLLGLIRSTRKISSLCRYRGSYMEISAGGEVDDVSLYLRANDGPEIPIGEVFRALLSPSGLPMLESLRLEGAPLFEGGTVVRSLSLLPSLKSFELVAPNQNPQYGEHHDNLGDICNAMALPCAGKDGGQASWLLPQLKELKIATLDGFEGIPPMIEARHGTCTTNPQGKVPAALKFLQLRTPPNMAPSFKRPIKSSDEARLKKVLEGTCTLLEISL